MHVQPDVSQVLGPKGDESQMTALHHCVNEHAVIREGHKPFSRTIGDALSELACRSVEDAFTRDSLEDMRLDRKRNHQVGGNCDNCSKPSMLQPIEIDGVEFLVCRKCR